MAVTSEKVYALAKSPVFRQRLIALIARKVGFVEDEANPRDTGTPGVTRSNNEIAARFSLARQALLNPEGSVEAFAWACARDTAIQDEAYPPNGTGANLDPLAVDENRLINVIDAEWSNVAGV